MIEIWLFGYLVVTLGSATALVLLLVALASVAYLAITLIPALAVGGSARVGLRVGVAVALVALLLSLAALRAGTPGSMGELLPTFALAVALAAAVGSAAALAWVGLARILRSAQEAATGRARRLDGARVDQVRRLETDRRAYLDGTDLVREVAEADDAVLRLRTALDRLERTRDDLQSRLVALGEDAAAGDLGRELRGARDDVAAKLDLGGKIPSRRGGCRVPRRLRRAREVAAPASPARRHERRLGRDDPHRARGGDPPDVPRGRQRRAPSPVSAGGAARGARPRWCRRRGGSGGRGRCATSTL